MYIGRETLATPTPVGQQVIQLQLQFDVVMPSASEVVSNSWKFLQECKRLDFGG